MKIRRSTTHLLSAFSLCLLMTFNAASLAQEPKPIKPDVTMLPPALRARGQAALDEKDGARRAKLAGDLADDEPVAALEFVLAVLDSDTAAEVRREIIDELSDKETIRSEPRFWRMLERRAASDPDAATAILALDKLRERRLWDLRALLDQRMELARRHKDDAAWRRLAQEDERWASLVRGTMLPAFLRTPPPVFALKMPDRSIRLLAMGDFGYGAPDNRQIAGDGQKQTAAAMLTYNRRTPHDFAITLGDNFYPDGMLSPSDPRWQTLWRDLYDPLGLTFYATLGNHDWHAADSPAAEILYSGQSRHWRMPAPYYSFTAGPAQFFALDTNDFSAAQALWLDEALAGSRARWKIVYGHHPIYSSGRHGDTRQLIERLLPLLKGRADVYLAGHEHDLQHLKPEGALHFFISGGGGAGLRTIEMKPRSLFAHSAHAFTSIEVDANKLTVKFIGTDLKLLYEYTLPTPI
jgi:3',5'-cyclic AMP phosphodiesterase CpdA